MRVLVTGGAGYVGSHAVRALCAAGHETLVYDNLSTGHAAAVLAPAVLVVGDVANRAHLRAVLRERGIEAVMHFAASIEVGESVRDPMKYYDNNVVATFGLLREMQAARVRRMVFSSTCATYGTPERTPIGEDHPQRPESPYARTKLAVEWALVDCAAAWGLGFAALRYFNAAGASSDAKIGEDHDPESHLIPNVLRAALGQSAGVRIFGTDYPTPDGTCLRDYVHVEDLADAHVRALVALKPGEARFYNCGTGRPASVREVIDAARRVTAKSISVEEQPRRPGDPSALFADASKIHRELGWSPRHAELHAIIASAWSWHQSHPAGFGDRRKP